MTSFVESTNDKVKTHLANGFKAMKNGQKTFFKFFIGILLLNLIIILFKTPVGYLISFNTQSLSKCCRKYHKSLYSNDNHFIRCYSCNHFNGYRSILLKTRPKITKDKVKAADKNKKLSLNQKYKSRK